jgi:hypothetical protein
MVVIQVDHEGQTAKPDFREHVCLASRDAIRAADGAVNVP